MNASSFHPFLDARRMASKRNQLRSVGSCGSCNSSLSDSSYNSMDEDGYEDDDEDSIGPLPGLQRHHKPLSMGRPSRRNRIEFIERRPNVHSRRLPYRLPDALILPPPPPPPPPPHTPLALRRFQAIQSPHPPASLETIESQFLISRKSSFMEQGSTEDEIKRPDPPEQQIIQRSMLSSLSAKRPHHQYHHHVSSSTTNALPGTVNSTTTRATTRKAMATRTLPYDSSATSLAQQQEQEKDTMYKMPKPRRMVSLPLLGRSKSATTKSPPAPPPLSFWPRRRSKSIPATFDGVDGVSTMAKGKKTNTKKSQRGQHPASPPVAFLARRSKSIAKTFDSVVGNNSSSSTPTTAMTSTISEMDDVWIERVLLRQGRPLHFYFQSVFSKKCLAEPPTGAIHVIYWDDLLRVSVTQRQQQQQQQLHQQHGLTTVANKANLGNSRSDSRNKTVGQKTTPENTDNQQKASGDTEKHNKKLKRQPSSAPPK